MTDITPALTADEWARPHHSIQCFDSWSDDVGTRTGVGEIEAGPNYLILTSHQHPEFAEFSAPEDRHALAALALHGQPFGFTWEDVDRILGHASEATWGPEIRGLTDIADRIAALLPPRMP